MDISYSFGTGADPTTWTTPADLSLGTGLDAVALDFDGDGFRDDAMWDADGDGRADTAVLDVGDDPSFYADPSGGGVWDEHLPARDDVTRAAALGTSEFTFVDYDGTGGTDDAQADLDGDGTADAVLIGAPADAARRFGALVVPAAPDRMLVDRDGDGVLDGTEMLS